VNQNGEGGRSREGCEEAAFAEQGMCGLRTPVYLAEEVGARLGVGEILQRQVQENGLMLLIMDRIHSFVKKGHQ